MQGTCTWSFHLGSGGAHTWSTPKTGFLSTYSKIEPVAAMVVNTLKSRHSPHGSLKPPLATSAAWQAGVQWTEGPVDGRCRQAAWSSHAYDDLTRLRKVSRSKNPGSLKLSAACVHSSAIVTDMLINTAKRNADCALSVATESLACLVCGQPESRSSEANIYISGIYISIKNKIVDPKRKCSIFVLGDGTVEANRSWARMRP